MPEQKGFSANLAILIAALAAVIVLVGLFFWFNRSQDSIISGLPSNAFGDSSVSSSDNQSAAGEDFYGVFLDSGEVFFGQIVNDLDDQFVELANVYYIQQVQQAAQTDPNTTEQPSAQLIKRGGEMHEPDGNMIINRDRINYIEKLRSDSEILQAIVSGAAD